MSTSCSDFQNDVWNRLVALNLVNNNAVEPDDLETQTAMATEAITNLSDKVSVLSNLLDELVGKLPANDAQAPLPMGAATLGAIEPSLRDKITKVLGAESLRAALHGPAARFMTEILDGHETVTDIADQYGARTLADVLYLHSAINKKTYIEVFQPTDSRILELVRQLPSADFWQQHIYVVAESKAA
jgi:hypothetical protein